MFQPYNRIRLSLSAVNRMKIKRLICNGTIFKSEAVAQRCSVKKVFLEILQNLQENTCARVSLLIKLQARPAI